MNLRWAESEFQLWKVTFFGSLNMSNDQSEDRTVFVIADEIDDAIRAVKTIHDKTAIIKSVKQVGLCVYQEELT